MARVVSSPRAQLETLTHEPVPAPVNVTDCGLLPAASKINKIAWRVPVPVGVKVTLMEQFVPGKTVVWQLLLWIKSPAKLPLRTMFVIESADGLPLVRTTVCCGLLVWIVWLANVSAVGETVAEAPMTSVAGAVWTTSVPVPVTVRDEELAAHATLVVSVRVEDCPELIGFEVKTGTAQAGRPETDRNTLCEFPVVTAVLSV